MLIQRQGAVRPFRSARTCLVATSILASGLAAPAFGQSVEPPPYQNADPNGLDLVTGKLGFSMIEGSVGTGENEIVLERILVESAGWTDNWSGKLRRDVSGGSAKVTIEFGAISNLFTISGTVATPAKADGSSLVVNGNDTYTFTARDGTVIVYETKDDDGFPIYVGGCAPGGNTSRQCGIPVSITKPNGAQFTLGWQIHRECNFDVDGDCATERAFARLAGISSPSENQVEFIYDDAAEGGSGNWYERLGARFIAAGETCEADCRTVNYTRSSSGGASILAVSDPMANEWRFASSTTSFGIRRPGSTSDDVTVAFTTGRIVSSVTRDAVTTNYVRAVSGSTATTTITNALSQATIVEADLTKGRLTSTKNPLNQVTSYDYDSAGRLTRTTFPEGNYIARSYDARGNVTQTTRVAKTGSGIADIVTSASYSSTCSNAKVCNQPNSATDARGKVTDYTYDTGHGGVLTITQPAATGGGTRPQTRYSYTTIGGVSLLTGVSACRTSASCTGTADETKTIAVYDTQHRLTSIAVAAGDGSLSATTAYSYDNVGNVVSMDGPLAGTADTTTYRYDAARRSTGIISADPDGSGPLKRRAQRNTYDSAGRLTDVEIGTATGTDDTAWAAFVSAQKLTSTYSGGYKTKDVLTAGGSTYQVMQYGYDAVGRIECTTLRMNPATWGSLPAACSLGTTGSAGPDRITKTIYDAASRVTKTQSAYGTTDQADEATVTYTDNGKVATATDGEGNKTTYEYDGFDRLSKTRYPSTTAGSGTSSTTDYEQLLYDAGSNVTTRRLRGYAADSSRKIEYSYDDLNRLTVKDLPGSEPDVTYSYDLLSRMTGASQTGNALTFGYDALSRNTSQGGPRGTVNYGYDAAGRRTRMTWPDAFYVDYTYYVTGEVKELRENGATSGAGLLASYAMDDLGRRTGITRGNGTSTTITPDAVSRLSSLVQNLSGTTNDLTLGFSYNPASQIATTTRSNDAYAWSGHYNVDRAYGVNGLNQVTTAGATSLSYDARGNLTASGADSYTYSSENLLLTGPGSASLSYDPMLRLYQTGPTTTRFQYDGLDLIAEYNASNVMTRRYVHGPGSDEPVVWYEGSGTSDRRWLHTDERGSVIAVTNASGVPITNGINTYDEYGIPGATNVGRFQYTGQTWLPELGVYYYKARMYSPTLGRFMQTDPIGYGDGMNLYAYVKGDPVNFRDPLGLQSEEPDLPECKDGLAQDCELPLVAKYEDAGWWIPSGSGPGVTYWPGNGDGPGLVNIVAERPQKVPYVANNQLPLNARRVLQNRRLCSSGQVWLGLPDGYILVPSVDPNDRGVAWAVPKGSLPPLGGAPAWQRANLIRYMYAGSSRYPTGYLRAYNGEGQPISIRNGRAAGRDQTHFELTGVSQEGGC